MLHVQQQDSQDMATVYVITQKLSQHPSLATESPVDVASRLLVYRLLKSWSSRLDFISNWVCSPELCAEIIDASTLLIVTGMTLNAFKASLGSVHVQ